MVNTREDNITQTTEIIRNHVDTHILVSGNGFDIEHGYKTGYKDFVLWTKELENCDNPFINYFQSKLDASSPEEELKWIDCEAEIAQIVNSFNKITSRIESKRKGYLNYTEAEIKPRDEFVYKSFPSFLLLKDNGVKVRKEYKNSEIKVYDKNIIISDLLSALNDAEALLKTYLEEATKGEVFTVFDGITFDYVINFNYTTTYRKYVSDEDKVYIIHGSLKYKEGDIVFGVSDSEEVKLDYIKFRKDYQRIRKRTPVFDIKEICGGRNIIGMPKSTAAHFYGCSMSSTDRDLLSEIIEGVNISYVYYNNQEDRDNKIQNLSGMLGWKKVNEYISCKKIVLEPKKEIRNRAKPRR